MAKKRCYTIIIKAHRKTKLVVINNVENPRLKAEPVFDSWI